MKYTITHTAEWILLAIITLLFVFTAYKSYQLKDKIETITATDTITHTITNWNYDTMYLSRLDTIKLPVVDTVNDTIFKIDSVLVQIPINTYQYDTTITDTNYQTSLKAVVEGFAVSLDTLSIHTEITQQNPKKQPWYGNIVPAVGVGFGTGGFGVFAGVGLKIF